MTLLVLVLANLNTLEGHISRPAISGEKMCCTHENFTHTAEAALACKVAPCRQAGGPAFRRTAALFGGAGAKRSAALQPANVHGARAAVVAAHVVGHRITDLQLVEVRVHHLAPVEEQVFAALIRRDEPVALPQVLNPTGLRPRCGLHGTELRHRHPSGLQATGCHPAGLRSRLPRTRCRPREA